jgi:hypothetical protein
MICCKVQVQYFAQIVYVFGADRSTSDGTVISSRHEPGRKGSPTSAVAAHCTSMTGWLMASSCGCCCRGPAPSLRKLCCTGFLGWRCTIVPTLRRGFGGSVEQPVASWLLHNSSSAAPDACVKDCWDAVLVDGAAPRPAALLIGPSCTVHAPDISIICMLPFLGTGLK